MLVKSLHGILALDLASTTGFALECLDGSLPVLGTHHFPRYSAQALGPQGRAFMVWVRDLIDGARPERVVYERPLPPFSQSSANVSTVTMGFAYVVEIVCAEQHIAVSSVPAATVRKFFTGSGKSQGAKGRVIQVCEQRGWMPPDDNAADAAAILAWSIDAYHHRDIGRNAAIGNITKEAA